MKVDYLIFLFDHSIACGLCIIIIEDTNTSCVKMSCFKELLKTASYMFVVELTKH